MFPDRNNISSGRPCISSCSSVKQAILDSDPSTINSYLDDLKCSIRLNKQLVQNLIFAKSNESSEDATVESACSAKTLEVLFNENKILEEKIDQTIKEGSVLRTRNLLSEQIYNESTLRYSEMFEEYQNEVSELKYQDERKEKVLKELILTNSMLRISADIAFKSKNTLEIKPNRFILDMHCKVEEIREFIQEKARENYSLEIQKINIEMFVEKIRKDIEKIKALCRNPVNRAQRIAKLGENECQNNFLKREMSALDLSIIAEKEISFVKKNDDEGKYEIEEELEGWKKIYVEKSEELFMLSEENQELREENYKLIEENLLTSEEIEEMQRAYEGTNITMEIKEDRENSLEYKLKQCGLGNVSDFDLSPTNHDDHSYNN